MNTVSSNLLVYHPNTGEYYSPPVCADWRVRVRYRGGPNFDPTRYKESGMPAYCYSWKHTEPPSEGDIVEYAVIG